MPDRRAGEAVHLRDAEPRGRAGGVLHSLGCPLLDPGRVAVSPDVGREDRLVARVDRVADRLADEMRAEREAVQVVALEHLLDAGAVVVLGQRTVDLEMVAPAGELEAVEAPAAGLLGQVLQRQVCPLAGEERDRSRHRGDLMRVASGRARRRRRPGARAPRRGSPREARPFQVAVREHQLHRGGRRQVRAGVRRLRRPEEHLAEHPPQAGEVRSRLGRDGAQRGQGERSSSEDAAATSGRSASTRPTRAERSPTAGRSTWGRSAASRPRPASRAATGLRRGWASGLPARATSSTAGSWLTTTR